LKSFANTIRAIFTKDLLCEFRTKQALAAMIIPGLIIVWIFRIAAESSLTNSSIIAAAALLVSMLFSIVSAAEKGFAIEHQNDCINALLLAPAEPGDIYIAKLLINITMLSLFELVVVPVLLVFFNISIFGRWLELIAVMTLINIGLAGVGTLLGCVVQGAKASNSLLSILLMAILCPMIIPAIFALLWLFAPTQCTAPEGGIIALVGDFSSALAFIAAFDAIFVTVCWLLFEFVLNEQEN